MTRTIQDELLKEETDTISDHLRNHLHLTNCIHLKNHSHRVSPNMTERSLRRDLIMLQKSKSLKDPSMSPIPWSTPQVVRPSAKKSDKERPSITTKREPIEKSSNMPCSEDPEPLRVQKHTSQLQSGLIGKGKSRERKFETRKRRIEARVLDDYSRVSTSSNQRCLSRGLSEVNVDLDQTSASKNLCGIPLNWSRNPSCGLSESRLRSSIDSGSESSPILARNSKSQEDTECSFMPHDRHPNFSQHQSLPQKYAPKNFKDLAGHNLVVQALSNAVASGKIGPFYVFHGSHGTGKTSCARVFAKAINCKSQGQLKPCGSCVSCVSFDLGRNKDIVQLCSTSGFHLLEKRSSQNSSKALYRVFILDDCDMLSSKPWNSIFKVVDQVSTRVVFILICQNVDSLPHMIISRSQKFFFPKLKDADITLALMKISAREGLEIDKDALRLIASRSDGSLRDGVMNLDQLSLLGQPITVKLVQELAGLISDEKLVDLLDLALSADTVNTVKRLRDIMEVGIEPLALMSQMAALITDILAGSHLFTGERLGRRFFRRQTPSKEDMESLRRALKTLSESEKQLRSSNDKWTWLTATLLHLAAGQQASPNMSANTEDLAQNTGKYTKVPDPTAENLEQDSRSSDPKPGFLRCGNASKVPWGRCLRSA
ncbi:AAA-type ATPase family protein isoform X2 [Wolffia australiana]